MTMDPQSLVQSLLTIALGGIAGYLAGYGKKKGENLATKEDMKDVLDQVSQVTATTKKIEADISSGLWDRQKRWELRRDVLFEAAKRIADLDGVLLSVDAVKRVEAQNEKDGINDLMLDTKTKNLDRWRTASHAYDETRFLVAVLCGKETKEAFDALSRSAGQVYRDSVGVDLLAFQNSQREFNRKLVAAQFVMRKELGIDSAL